VVEVKAKVAPSLLGTPLFTEKLSDKQWTMLESIQQEMQDEYTMRREMMIQRLDLTIQSFLVRYKLKVLRFKFKLCRGSVLRWPRAFVNVCRFPSSGRRIFIFEHY